MAVMQCDLLACVDAVSFDCERGGNLIGRHVFMPFYLLEIHAQF